MKKLSIFLSVAIVTALCFWAFLSISLENQYTSVRKYTKPKIETTTPLKDIVPQTIKETVVPVQDTPSQVVTEPIPSGVIDTTPPVIEFLNYKDGDSVSLSLINILVKVTDNVTSSEKIIIE